MDVLLGEKWEQFVASRVQSGSFQTASEVLREGLRLLEKEELLKSLSAGSPAELEARLLEAAASLDGGKQADAGEMFARLRQRSTVRRTDA